MRPRRGGQRGRLGDASGRLSQAVLAEAALANGVDEGGLDARDLLRREVGAEAQRIGTGGQGPNGSRLEADGRADRVHLKRVRDHEAAEAELRAQDPDDVRAQRRRLVVERSEAHVRSHHCTRARPDSGSERG